MKQPYRDLKVKAKTVRETAEKLLEERQEHNEADPGAAYPLLFEELLQELDITAQYWDKYRAFNDPLHSPDTCQSMIDDIQAIQADDKDPNDCATQPHELTHLPDMLRYFCISRTIAEKEGSDGEVVRDDAEDNEEEYENYMTGGAIPAGYIFA